MAARTSARARIQGPPSPRPGTDAGAAIAALLDTHGAKLHGLALRMCKNSADAQDMVQDTFLQAFRKWHTFKGDAAAGTWLYSIAARSCKARMRRKGGVDRRMPAVSQLMPWNETTVMRVAAGDDGARSAERKEAVGRVQLEIARLPEHLRVPLVLKEVLEIGIEDVADALGLSTNTVKTRIHRARLALRKAMTARATIVAAPAPIYEKQVCLDLLKTKMESMDRGGVAAGFKVPQADVCARCRAVFRELDIVQDACAGMGEGTLPPGVRRKVLEAIEARDADERAAATAPSRGRRPIMMKRTVGRG